MLLAGSMSSEWNQFRRWASTQRTIKRRNNNHHHSNTPFETNVINFLNGCHSIIIFKEMANFEKKKTSFYLMKNFNWKAVVSTVITAVMLNFNFGEFVIKKDMLHEKKAITVEANLFCFRIKNFGRHNLVGRTPQIII